MDDDDDDISDYENSPAIAGPVRDVMWKTGLRDAILAGEVLQENAFCVEAAVDYLLQMGSFGVGDQQHLSKFRRLGSTPGNFTCRCRYTFFLNKQICFLKSKAKTSQVS